MTKITVNISGATHHIDRGVVHGSQIIALASIGPDQHVLLDVKDEVDVPLSPTDLLIREGGERFAVGTGHPEQGDNPCRRTPLRFHLNGKAKESLHAKLTGAEIKAMAGASYANDRLWCDPDYAPDVQLRDDQRIVLTPRDRFITNPCGNVGFDTLAEQLAEVQRYWPDARLYPEGENQVLIIPDYLLDDHWSLPKTDLLVWIPSTYPTAGLDMFYVAPFLTLKHGGTPAGGEAYLSFQGKPWQRFSWHYGREWQPQHDTLMSHLRFCADRLRQAQ